MDFESIYNAALEYFNCKKMSELAKKLGTNQSSLSGLKSRNAVGNLIQKIYTTDPDALSFIFSNASKIEHEIHNKELEEATSDLFNAITRADYTWNYIAIRKLIETWIKPLTNKIDSISMDHFGCDLSLTLEEIENYDPNLLDIFDEEVLLGLRSDDIFDEKPKKTPTSTSVMERLKKSKKEDS
jgi:hypothetical protein